MSFAGLLCHTCNIQVRARSQLLTYSAPTGTPVVGQTIAGGTSLKTAVITRVLASAIVIRTLSGNFTIGETIATGITFTATVVSQANYTTSSGEFEYYWTTDQSSVPCRFYYTSGFTQITDKNVLTQKPLQVMFAAGVTLNDTSYRIVTTATGYAGTYDITMFPKPDASQLHHYEGVLQKVITP